jgi:hypothetical protein
MVVATPGRLHEQKVEAGCCGPHLVPSQPWSPPRSVIAHVHLHAPEGHRRCRGPDLPRVRARLLADPRSRVAAAEAKIIPRQPSPLAGKGGPHWLAGPKPAMGAVDPLPHPALRSSAATTGGLLLKRGTGCLLPKRSGILLTTARWRRELGRRGEGATEGCREEEGREGWRHRGGRGGYASG